jgi:DNA-binding response OmpR family regulator
MPFLYLTALSDRANELKGRQLGADDYITKPIDFDILNARLAGAARAAVWPRQMDLDEREAGTLTWGKTSTEFAETIGLAKRTIDIHRGNACL